MNNRGQIDFPLISFIVIIVTLLVLGPILLKIMNSILTPVQANFGNMTVGGAKEAAAAVTYIHNTTISFWDWVLLMLFIVQVLLLFISAFMIDVHPVWIVIYIFIAFFTFMMAPGILQTLNVIWTPLGAGGQFGTEAGQMPIMNFIETYFGVILVGLYMLTGIIMYGKFKLGGSNI